MRPSLLTVNPQTGQAYTAAELADLKVNSLLNQYKGDASPYGDLTIRTEDAVLSPLDKNDYSAYTPNGYQIGADNAEIRAQLQPWYEQLGRGVVKGTGVAASTFVDGTVGIVAGLANMATGGEDQNLLNRFINNPLSNAVVDFQKYLDEELPNYYTKEEMDSPWWQNLATSNFWGDNVIKNMGFAVGALGAGVVTAGIGAEALGITRLSKTSKLLEGVAKGAEAGKKIGQAEGQVLKALSAEDLTILRNPKVLDELEATARALKSKTAQNQLLSSFVGSVGEARIEALSNAKQYKEMRAAELDTKLQSGEIDEVTYSQEMANLDKNTLNNMNATFASNVGLLSLFNYIQFKNVFSRGFTPNRAVTNEVANINAKGLYEIEAKGRLSKALDAATLLKNPLAEMSEEQLQGAISKGMEHYYDLKTDAESNADVKNWLNSMAYGLGQAYGTEEGWEQAVSGFIIGALGVPTFKADSKLKIGMAGGIREDYKERKAANEGFRRGVEVTNKLLEDSPIRKLFDAAVVDKSLQRLSDQSVVDNDRANDKTINAMQLANMVDAFVEIGKYDDFVKLLEDEKALNATELREKYKTTTKSAVTGKDVTVDFFKGMTDDQVEAYIKRKADKAKQQAEQIKGIKQNIDNRFTSHSSDAKKDLLLKSAATLDIDDRITRLGAELKELSTYGYTPKGIEEFEKTAGVLDFLSLTKPIDFENYLTSSKGLEEFQSLMQDYLSKETDTNKALELAEKARDLFTLVNKRQALNDSYFKMADAEYAANQDALNQSAREQEELASKAQDLRYKQFYDQNTSYNDREGFFSTQFQVDNGKRNKVTVKGIDRATGQEITLEDAYGDDSKPGLIDEQGNPVKRTATTGNVFANYKAMINGQERSFEIINPQETTEEVDDVVSLEFRKDDPNNLYDEDGNAYSIAELEQDPSFLASNILTVTNQRAEFINNVRRESLQTLIQSNQNLINNVNEQIKGLESKIEETKTLLQRAQRNKSGRVRINGTKKVAKVFELEAQLSELEKQIDDLITERGTLEEEGQRLNMQLQQAVAAGFDPNSFAEDIQIVANQVNSAEQAIANAAKKVKALKRTITALKNLLKVVYPKFKKAYIDIYGVDPSTISDIVKRWQTEVTPILRKLRAEEITRYENIAATEREMQEVMDAIAEMEQYLADSKALLERLEKDRAYFEAALDKAYLVRRLKQGAKTTPEQSLPGIEKEIDATSNEDAAQFVSAKRSINDMFATAGQHFDANDKINPKPWAQRWFKAISKINLSAGNFALKVVNAKQRPDLFADVPADLKEDALAVILFKDGKPVDENFQPISETSTAELLYSFVPLPSLESAEFGPKFRDAAEDPTKTQELVDKLKALRTELHKRVSEGTPTFLPVTEKSAGLLQTTGAKRTGDQDLTTAVWTTLFKDEEDAKSNFNKSKIVVGKAKTPEEVKAGTAVIYVGGKEVTVKNGIAYFITPDAVVVPLLARKVTNEESEVLFDLLSAVANGNNELGADKEVKEGEEEKGVTTKAPKAKRVFKQVYNRTQERAAKAKGKKIVTIRGKKGYFVTKSAPSKTSVKAAKRGLLRDRIKLLPYISQLIFFGPQSKGADSTLISNPNQQTEIFISPDYKNITFYDFGKKAVVTIPFTPESLAKNEEALMTFLANKYHQVKSNLLSKDGGEYREIVRVVKDEAGRPLYVETRRHTSYQTYLVSNKSGKNAKGETTERSVEDIPLTTNVAPDAKGEIVVKSTYLKFSPEVEAIKDAPITSKTPPKAPAAPTKDSGVLKTEAVIDTIDELINAENFDQGTILEKIAKPLVSLGYTEAFFKEVDTLVKESTEDEVSAKLDSVQKDSYFTLKATKTLLQKEIAAKVGVAPIASDPAALPSDIGGGTPFDISKLGSADTTLDSQVEALKNADAAAAQQADEDDADEDLFRTQTTGAPTIDIKKAKAWLNKNLPNVPLEIRDKIANGLAQGKIDTNGVMHLSNFAEEGTEYHEALHAVMLGILSDEELAAVYKDAKKLFGKPTEEQLAELKKTYPRLSPSLLEQRWYDEQLAEGFRDYALSRDKIAPTTILGALYQKLLQLIEAVKGLFKARVINELYNNLYTGYYANSLYDQGKVKSRLANTHILRPIQGLKNVTKAGVEKPMDLLKSEQITKETVNVVVSNLFKELFNDITNIQAMAMSKGAFNVYINKAIKATIKQIDSLPQNARLDYLKTKVLNERKAEVVRVVKEYVQKDLGIDLGLYDDAKEFENEDNKEAKDSVVKKDSTTIHPREGTSAFVKLLVASLEDYTRDEQGQMVPKVGEFFGLPELVNPNSAYNYLLKTLHNATSINQMMSIMEANQDKVPYLKQLLRLLNDPQLIKPLDGTMLKVNFLQSMYKSAVNYRMWLVNKEDVVAVNPNAESQERRIEQKWRNALVESVNTPNSVVTKPKSGKLPVVNAAAVKQLLKDSKEEAKEGTFNYWVAALNKFGFTITAPEEYSAEERDLLSENASWLFATLSKENVELDYLWNKLSAGRVENLIKLEAARNYDVTDLQHIGPDGKTRYGITEHNMVSMIGDYINSMEPGTSIQTLYATYPALDSIYTRNSYFLHNVLFKDGVRTSAPFQTSILEGARINEPGQEGETNTKMVKADRAWMSFNAVLTGLFPLIRTSDKSLEYGIQTKVPFTIDKIGENVGNYLDVFVGYLVDELNMGRSTDVSNIKNFDKNIGNGLYFFKDILKGKVRSILPTESVNEYINKERDNIEEAILEYLDSHDTEVREYMSKNDLLLGTKFTALDRGILESGAPVADVIRAFSVNYLIGNIEQTKMFFGHPAFYKNSIELFKRTAGAVGTKQVALVDDTINAFLNAVPTVKQDGKTQKNGNIDVVVLQEPVTNSEYYNEYVKLLGEEMAKKYLGMEEADGQGYITLPEYRELMIRIGSWNNTMEGFYIAVMRGEGWTIPKESINTVFNPLKAQYYGMHKMGDTSFPVFLKFSLLPLIPSVYKGTNMEPIAESMMQNGQGVAVYPSGIKLGALMQDGKQFLPMYDEDGTTSMIPSDVNILSLDYRFMGIQVQTGNKIKETTPRGTQQAKIVVSNMFENGVAKPISVVTDRGIKKLTSEQTAELVKEYHTVTNKITEAKIKELLEGELGATKEQVVNIDGNLETVYKIKNQKKLATILKKASLNRSSPDNIVDSFDITEDEAGEEVRFKYLLDAVPGRNKIENLLFSLVNNNIISQEFYGGTRIQAAGTGFENTPRKSDNKALSSNPALKFYRKGKFGETLPAQVKMSPNKNMVRLINKIGKQETLSENIAIVNELLKKYLGNDEARYNVEAAKAEGLPIELFQFVGYRIPTQGMNTIEHLEVIEFLDPLNGEAMQLPSELVAKSGGDYDIDKINVYFKQFNDQGELITNGKQGLQNRLVELNQAFLAAPENMEELLTPNSPITLEKLAEEIGRADKVGSTESLSWLFNLKAAEMFVVGKAAVGITARHITHHTLAQQADLKVNQAFRNTNKQIKAEFLSSELKFEGMQEKYSLGGVKDVTGKHKINNIISEFLSAFVDVVKDPFVFDINGSTDTADVYMYLVRRGLPIETAVYFMNQPIIKMYLDRLSNAKAMFKEGKTDLDGEDLTVRSSKILADLEALLNNEFKKSVGDKADISKISFKFLTQSELKNNLKSSIEGGDVTFIRTQYQVLQNFLNYQQQANNLRALMDATSQDTTKPKNFNASDEARSRMKEVEATEMFDMDSVERIFSNTFLGGFREAQNTTDTFRDLFITERPGVRKAFDRLRSYLTINRVTGDKANVLMDRAKNDFIVYLASRFLKEVAGLDQKSMFVGENTTAKKLAATLKSPNPAIKNNPFYKNMYPLLENIRANVEGIKMFNGKMNAFDFNQMVNGMRAISDDSKKVEYAIFALLQSGLDNSPITWYDKVPIELMATRILGPAIKAYMSTITSGDVDAFFTQFIKNNYIYSDLVPNAGVFKGDGTGTIGINSAGEATITKKILANRQYVKLFAPFPQYYGKDKKIQMEKDRAAGLEVGEMLLLARVGKDKFKLVSKQGDKMYMKEYSYAIRSSILKENNPNEGAFKGYFPNWSEPAPTVFTENPIDQSDNESKNKCKGK